jgi:hypothetical protein
LVKKQLLWRFNLQDIRHIGNFPPTVTKIKAQWGLRSSGDTDQDDLGLIKFTIILTIIMAHCEIDRLNALKLVGLNWVEETRFGAR